MKIVKLLLVVMFFVICAVLPVNADVKLPDTGTYFIVNASSGEALQPVDASPGQNVMAAPMTKAGAQKWHLTRKIDPKTKKPTNRYTIRLAGEIPDLNFQPHGVADRPAIISSGTSVMVLEPGADGFLIKSVTRNGDALFIYPVPEIGTEAHFGPNDGSSKFRWTIEAAN